MTNPEGPKGGGKPPREERGPAQTAERKVWTPEELDKITYRTNLGHGKEKRELEDLPAIAKAISGLSIAVESETFLGKEKEKVKEGSPYSREIADTFDQEVERLEQELGITFADQNLLRAALTHKKASFPVKRESPDEEPRFLWSSNANIETYGDIVLGEYITNEIVPRLAEEMGLEGQYLKNVEDMLNSNLYLSVIAARLRLHMAIRMDPQMIVDQRRIGKTETGKGHIDSPAERRKRGLGDPMEALVGAIHLNSAQNDGGESFKKFMDDFFYPRHPADGGDQKLYDLIRLVGSPNLDEVVTSFDRLARGNASLKTERVGKTEVKVRNQYGRPVVDKTTRKIKTKQVPRAIVADIRFDESMYHNANSEEGYLGDLMLIGHYEKDVYDTPEFIGRAAGKLFSENTWLVCSNAEGPANLMMPSSASEDYLAKRYGALLSAKGIPGEKAFRLKKIDARRIFDIEKRILNETQQRAAAKALVEYLGTNDFLRATSEVYEQQVKKIIDKYKKYDTEDYDLDNFDDGLDSFMFEREIVLVESAKELMLWDMFEDWMRRMDLDEDEEEFARKEVHTFIASSDFVNATKNSMERIIEDFLGDVLPRMLNQRTIFGDNK